jgi:hypothetical protein
MAPSQDETSTKDLRLVMVNFGSLLGQLLATAKPKE